MPVAHYNSYLTTGEPHPAYRSYDTGRGMGPPAGSLSGGVPLPHARQPSLHCHQNRHLLNPSGVPTFSLPHSGVPYTGPFPPNGMPTANYQRGLGQMASSSQHAMPLPNSHAAGASMGNNTSSSSSSGGGPVGYSSGMGSGMSYPAHPVPHQQQHIPPQLMEPHDHYMGSRGHQYPVYGTPPEEERSRYYNDQQQQQQQQHQQQQQQQQLQQQQQQQRQQQHQQQQQSQQQQHHQHGAVMQRPMSTSLSTIYEGGQKDDNKYRVEEYLQQHHPSSERSQHHSAGQIRLNPPAEVQEHHALPPPAPPAAPLPQVVPTPKVEPDWWHDSDVLVRFQQIHLHADSSPSRDKTTPRRKRRNSEKRKEKSRDAARCRRGKESEIFTELANALPLPAQTIAQLDKASVMRLTIAYLKTRSLCQAGLTKKCDGNGDGKLDVEMDALFLKALDGFLLVLSTDADIIYTSENIASFLGLPQVDVMGQCLYEYAHPCDHDEVRDLVSEKGPQEARHAFLRLKCTLTAKGRSVNLKSASYKVVQVSGELVRGEDDEAWLVALGTPVPHPSNIEFPLDKQTFVSKHSLDMKFTYVDDNVSEFCGYGGEELIGMSLYEMHHALDSDLIKDAYKTLRSKGQVETGRYRFLAREGGYVWVVTQATLIHGPKDHKPQYVVCLNYVVSGVESPGEVLSELQLKCSNSRPCAKSLDIASPEPVSSVARSLVAPTELQHKAKRQPEVTSPSVNGSPAEAPAPATRIAPVPPPPPTPVATTFKIFTPRTEEMNKGYLIFSENDPLGIVMKDEPDDLTHLAPSGGDTCVPLEVPTFIPELDDMFALDCKQIPISSVDALFTSPTAISENFLEDSLRYKEYEVCDTGNNFDRLSGSKILANKSGCSSPLSNCSSPIGGLRTPEPPKTSACEESEFQLSPASKPSLKGVVESSRPRTTTESLFTQLDEAAVAGSAAGGFTKLELKMEDENMDADEFDMRAPYIPLSNELLMLNQDDLMWGAQSEPVISPGSALMSKRDSKCTSIMQDEEDSSLAQLLQDRDPPIAGPGPGPGKNIQSGNPNGPHRNQYQQSKFLDGGGSFVDPNKVLPGHFGGKDGIDDGGGTVEELPLQLMMHEPVEPPPPLVAENSHHQSTLPVKRRYSPSSSPLLTHKKLCSSPYDQQQQQQTQRSLQLSQECSPQQRQLPQLQTHPSGVRELTTPYAPTMQQLLISKEPIMVRGGRPGGGGGGGGGGGISAPLLSMHKGKDSVLRNLLVSGRDDSAGYSVSAPPSPASTPSRSSTVSPGPHLIHFETKGGKNLSNEGADFSNGGETKQSAAPVRVTQDQMTAMLLADGGSIKSSSQMSYPKLRILTGGQGSLIRAEHHSLKMMSESGSGGGSSTVGGSGAVSGERFVKRGRRQDPFLLMDPDLTIPNLFDLSQLDYEVNAPANNSSLLQGADLLMALDQSL